MKELAQKMQINLYRHISEGYSYKEQDGYTDAVNDLEKLMVPIELNENQQIVLEWLKWSIEEQGNSPMDAIYLLVLGEALDSVSLAYIALTPEQQKQVLAVFSKEVAE